MRTKVQDCQTFSGHVLILQTLLRMYRKIALSVWLSYIIVDLICRHINLLHCAYLSSKIIPSDPKSNIVSLSSSVLKEKVILIY